MWKIQRVLSVAAVALVALAGCSDDDGPAGPDGDEASFGIILQEGSASGISPAVLGHDGFPRMGARIPLDRVDAITLSIGDVEARQADGSWLPAGTADQTVNLLDLPAEGLDLVDSSLPEGDYDKLRLYLTEDPTITLGQEVRVGRSTFEAGEQPLSIPSADQNGLRLRAEFTVDAGGEVLTILFDGDATVRRVTATGSGVLRISPELTVRNQDGEDVGEEEGDDDEDEGEDEAEGLVVSVSDDGFTLDGGLFVQVTEDTEIEGDILTLEDLAEVVDGGEEVEAEVEGTLSGDGTTMVADEVEFETDDDDGDGDAEDDDEEFEVEGPVTAVDRGAGTFTVDDAGETFTVLVDENTEIEDDGDFTTFESMADAFDAGTPVQAEAEGELQDDGTLLADEVEFETDDEDEDADEVEGPVTAVDRSAGTFTVDDPGGAVTVAVDGETTVDPEGDFATFEAMADAFDADTPVRAEAEGELQGDGTLLAETVKFETDEGDGDA